MQPSSSGQKPGPSGEGGSAFNALAGYIFGKNDRQQKMSMTTPVFTDSQGKMQFVVSTQQVRVLALPSVVSSTLQSRLVRRAEFYTPGHTDLSLVPQ